MSVIVGFVDDGRVWMGSDSLGVNGWEQKFQCESKIIRRTVGEGECLIGVAGDGALISRLRYDFEVPPFDPGAESGRWVHSVASALTALCRDAQPAIMNESGSAINATFLVGFGGALWNVATNQAWPIERWAAIGSGDEYASGVLYALDAIGDDTPPDGRIQMAIKAAAKFNLHCGGRIHLEVA